MLTNIGLIIALMAIGYAIWQNIQIEQTLDKLDLLLTAILTQRDSDGSN